MPELPEVETVCRGLAARLEGRRLVRVELRRPDLREPIPAGFAAAVRGRRVEAIRRRAKYILIHLDGGPVVIAHLGMSGRMVISDGPAPPPGRHDHVVFETDDGATITFNDARRFGLLDLTCEAALAGHPRLAGLGPEPLGADFTGAALALALRDRRTPIKAALLDQRVVAGLGNIYVSESLFHAGIDPARMAASVQGRQASRLVAAIRRVLRAAIAAGGSSLRDYVQANGELGYFQHSFAVYGRTGQPCPGCTCDPTLTGGIARLIQANRSTFYCPHRQR
ncbi:MAG: bifunctional DNA-formamidopyrimidine glycosylase/DNA-(apurinic or apyrimidinic site) lyase [Azospirillum sp.]|nr:bifunctional DNA-formamidopyrimidine glycosylase/DNA-(apurinic or apyrimidinic site) lyase [Azospirillum sp.]